MNIRIKKIILMLINSNYVTVKQLADHFSVSMRSIRNDIINFNNFLKLNNILPIEIKSNGELIFNNYDLEKALTLLLKSNFYDYKLSKAERTNFIIETLLINNRRISINNLSEKLYVSITTITTDLKLVKSKLKQYNLKYDANNRGITVLGDEINKRLLLLDLTENNELYYNTQNSLYFSKISDLIAKFETDNNLLLSDNSFSRLANYLIILIIRKRTDFDINILKSNKEYLYLANILLNKVLDAFSLPNIDSNEVKFLSYILSTLKYLKKPIYRSDIIRVQIIVKKFIESIEKQIGIHIKDDYLLLSKLSFHIESMLDNSFVEFNDRDQFIGLEERYIYVDDIVKNNLIILQALIKRNMSDIEIKLIVLHVCAAIERKFFQERSNKVLLVSDLGISSLSLISQRLVNNFDFMLVDIIPTHLINNYDLSKIDIVISTQQLNIDFLNVITINPMLNHTDYARLFEITEKINSKRLMEKSKPKRQKFINQLESIVNRLEMYESDKRALVSEISELTTITYEQNSRDKDFLLQKSLSSLLPINHIKTQVHVENWQESIRISGEILLKSDYIERRYIESMISNVMRNGSYIVIAPGVACAHAGIEDGSKKLGYSLIVLEDGVDFNSELGLVFLVFCLSAIDVSSHLKSFMNLTDICNNSKVVASIRRCKSAAEIHKLIQMYE